MWMASRVGGRDYPASDVASKIAFDRLRRSTLITFLLMPYWFMLVLGFFRSARSSLSCLRSSSEGFSQSRCADPVARLEPVRWRRSTMSSAQLRTISRAASSRAALRQTTTGNLARAKRPPLPGYGANCYLLPLLNFRDAAAPSPRGVLAYATARRLPFRLMSRY